nr:MAG TPA: hypothetical protein [Caudoviricetes sp.]
MPKLHYTLNISIKKVCLISMPYSMSNLLFNTPQHCNSPSQSPLSTNHPSS